MSNRPSLAWLATVSLLLTSPCGAQSDELAVGPSVIAADPARDTVQDMAELRRVVSESAFVPKAEMLSFEGLASEQETTLAAARDCGAPLCLAAHAMLAEIPARPDDRFFVGLAMASGDPATSLPSAPLNLIFVIDRSGSMEHGRLERVKEGLLGALSQLRDDDRLALVEFDDNAGLLLSMNEVGVARERMSAAIQSLKPDGLTNMEAGLDLALRMAFAEQELGAQDLHIVLVSDEHPDRDPARERGFMALMREAGQRSIGANFVGVEQAFDSVFAMRLSASAGAKLYSYPRDGDLGALFAGNFPAMIGEQASDVALLLTPAPGLDIGAILGVAPELVSRAAGGGTLIRLGPGFAGSNGQLFVTLAPQHGSTKPDLGGPVLTGELRYRTDTGDYLTASAAAQISADAPSVALQTYHALADEYLTLASALTAYHSQEGVEIAYLQAASLGERLAASGIIALKREATLASAIAERLERRVASQGLADSGLLGRWQVRGRRGLTGAAKGDIVELTEGGELLIHRKSGIDAGTTTRQTFQLGEGQLLVDGTDLVFDYRLKGDALQLVATRGGDRLKLKRAR